MRIKSPAPKPRPPQRKKDNSLEAQLAALRSSGSAFNRQGNLNIIGAQVKSLESQIQKKTRLLI